MKTQIKYLDYPALAEVRTLFALAWPVVGNNLVVSLMSFTDVVMAGRLSGADLAAVAVGSNVWLLFFLAARGVLAALSPIISQHHGARRIDLIGSYVRHGLALALMLSLAVLAALQFGAGPLLEAVGIDPSLRVMATDFVKAIAWGAPALCVFLVFRFALEGMGSTRPIFFLSIIGLLFNVATNFVFIYGYLGAPAMGGVGCGVASALSMWLILLVTVAYILCSRWLDVLRNVVPGSATSRVPWEILRLGVPIAGAVVAENGFFVAVTLVMGRISVNAAAAHQIAMNYASIMFMIPMALASALAVRVGRAVGEGNLVEARKRGTVGILACAVVMTISAYLSSPDYRAVHGRSGNILDRRFTIVDCGRFPGFRRFARRLQRRLAWVQGRTGAIRDRRYRLLDDRLSADVVRIAPDTRKSRASMVGFRCRVDDRRRADGCAFHHPHPASRTDGTCGHDRLRLPSRYRERSIVNFAIKGVVRFNTAMPLTLFPSFESSRAELKHT